ncbi:hypothetical protein DPV78_000013, partial [Talaromyces pinophilus]
IFSLHPHSQHSRYSIGQTPNLKDNLGTSRVSTASSTMAELHRPSVALSTFGIQYLLPTCPSAYKNVPRTHGYWKILPDALLPINMGDQARMDRVNRILDRVDSLNDLSADDIIELRHISESSLVIDKFKVSSAEYWDWINKVGDNIRGVEYDARNAPIVLKGGRKWMHEAATGVIYVFLDKIRDTLNAATGLDYSLSGGKECLLNDEFESVKQADASLERLDSKRPTVVLEVGVSVTTNKLYDDAERWLAGNSDTKLVILVDIMEKDRRKTSNDNWGLSATDFREKVWYRSKGILLVGTFELSVHLWYSDHDRRCIMSKATFSPGNLIDLTTIQDYP